MNWSLQLYSAHDSGPLTEVLGPLARAGYAQVEGYGPAYDDANEFRAALKKVGLKMPSGHFSIEALESDFDRVILTARTLGIKVVVCPWLEPQDRPSTIEGWQKFGKRLGRIAKKIEAEGLHFAWHNHEFEFRLLPDGSAPMRHILGASPRIQWEIDVAWVIRSGNDPLPWITTYGDRIVAAHVKDIAPEGANAEQDGWADVGTGTVDWKGLYRLLRKRTKAKYFVVEHDRPGDVLRFANRSIATLKSF